MIGWRFCILIFALHISILAFAQGSQTNLENKRKKIETEIAYTNKLLNETQSSKKVTVNQLRLLNVKVSQRENLLATLKSEVYYIEQNIEETEISLSDLNEELTNLKQKYAAIAWHVFKYKTSYNKLVFLFSAKDINQAYQRMRYLDQMSSYIRKEAGLIKETDEEKNRVLAQLKVERLKKSNLLDSEQVEILELEKEQDQKKQIKSKLQSKERELKKSIKEKEKQSKKLSQQIQKIIAAEIAIKTDAKTGHSYGLTPSEKELSSSFVSNKGKLPWPTERGFISETYGVHTHPVLKKVKTKNNGINILTEKGSQARAVFSGKVVSITHISSTNIAIIIKHGEFFTVYSSLDQVFVSKGDMVDTKAIIGRIHTNLKGKTELHFEVWKGVVIQNPSYWVVKK